MTSQLWLPHCRPFIRDTDGWTAVMTEPPGPDGLARMMIVDPKKEAYTYHKPGMEITAHISHALISYYV